MPVSATNKEYNKTLPKWQLTRNAANGLTIETAKLYIPRRTLETDDKWYPRLEKAIYTNYTGRTREGLKGAIFRLDPRIELPPDIEFMYGNADGSGQSLVTVAKLATDEILETGRFGMLADYPPVMDDLTAEQQMRMELQPHIATYTAETIINWHTHIVNGRRLLGMVVLKEQVPVHQDEFVWEYEDRFRVLRLTENGYTQQLYDKDGDAITEEVVVRDAAGRPFEYIPFHFIGSQNNLPDCDEPVLYDIARINIGHFRNSADHESNLSMHGGATMVISTDMSPEAFNAVNPGGVTVGENTGLILSEGGKAELLQLQPASAIKAEMEHKEMMMVQIGAKIISKNTTQRTAEEARIQAASEHSMLDTLVGNIDEAMNNVIYDCRRFVSTTEADIAFELNSDFWQDSLTPQEIMAMIQGNDAGVMPKSDIVRRMKDAGWISSEETPDDILSMIQDESPI